MGEIGIATISGLPEGHNTAKCKTCIFGDTPIELAKERMVEIYSYLANGTRHLCHTTNKTCFGGLEFQSRLFHLTGFIQEPTVECLLKAVIQWREQNT